MLLRVCDAYTGHRYTTAESVVAADPDRYVVLDTPALDANGNLIGLNFDRQWEGTMSDINFDPRFSRNIMVDTKYILFIVDKYADAKWLLNEMKIVK